MPTQRVVLAEYFTTADATLLFVVRKDFPEPQVCEIPLPLDELHRFVSTQELLLRAGRAADNMQEWQRQLDLLSPLVEPILSWSDIDDIVWLVPHGPLHYVPLHALKVGREQQYFIERNPICYTPSASAMRFCRNNRTERRRHALVLGDSRSNLLYACEEAISVAELFDTQPYLREQATKTLVKAMLRDRRDTLDILHFSCHGRFDQVDALQSGIELAPDEPATPPGQMVLGDGGTSVGKENGQRWNLTAAEIFSLSMRADLVTLSACDTGVNERRPGDELIGLTRALIYAGTASVIVSLWAVASLSTSLLMQHFYQRLLASSTGEVESLRMTKVVALQSAQLYVRGLTAQQLAAYCKQRLGELDRTEERERALSLQLGLAYAQYSAHDLAAALSTYRIALQHVEGVPGERESGLANQVKDTINLLEAYLEGQDQLPAVDYGVKPFEHPYYWAPFILVGDWK